MIETRKQMARRVQEAETHLAGGNAELAYQMLLQAEQDGARAPGLYRALGKASLTLQHFAESEDWWNRAAKRSPTNAECHLGLGTARYRNGRLADAIDSYRAALDIVPDLGAAQASLALAYLEADCPAQALSYAEAVLARETGNVDMRLTRAAALVKLGRPADAIGDLACLHDEGAKLGEVALLECTVNRALGDYEAALMLAAELAEAYPSLPAPLHSFRTTFEQFVASASPARLNDFLTGVGLPPYGTRIAGGDKPRLGRRRFPKTDVIIPVHDALNQLKECVHSLLAHRSPSLGRIILVNDCSTATTRAWLRRIERSEEGIQVVHTRRRSGFSRALEFGLSHSTAKRFVALNSDCIVGEAWLERLNAAMQPNRGVAMVGPVSNNAGWQNLGAIYDSAGNYTGEPLPNPPEMERIQQRLDLLKVFDAPDTSLVHGFCVLLDRAIYDRLHGLDVDLFPKGYGEFQDLSLRALDAGFTLRIADDCFVAHARGSSISASQRAHLSREARRSLYARYTALRYLSAESSSALNPQLSFTRLRFQTLNRYCPGAVTAWSRPSKATVFGDIQADFHGQRVCVFVSFSPDGRLLPYTLHYLSQLKAQGFQNVLILNEVGRHRLPPEALSLARIVMLRDNQGLDFAAWRDALARFPGIWSADLVLFANDSIVGPFGGFDRLVERIDQDPAPLFYLTESEFVLPHFQSFFWGLKGDGLTNPVVRAYLESVIDLTDKTAAIFLYEVFFRHVSERLGGLRSVCLFPLASLTGVDSDIRPTFNPTHHLWRELLRAGFPFLKTDFCRKNAIGPDADAWQAELAACGGDKFMARLHIEAVQVQRMRR